MTEERPEQQSATPPAQDDAKRAEMKPTEKKGDVRTFRIRQRPQGRGKFGARRRDQKTDIPEQSDYEEKSLEIARVTRVTAGGKRMRFRAHVRMEVHRQGAFRALCGDDAPRDADVNAARNGYWFTTDS